MRDESTAADHGGGEKPEAMARCEVPGPPEVGTGPTTAPTEPQPVSVVGARAEADPPGADAGNGLQEFERLGGLVLPTPDNLGHLSHVYRLVRPGLIRTLFRVLALPDTGPVRLHQVSWQGCALAWAHEAGAPPEGLRAEAALHIGGKDVNQDGVGTCTGVLQTEEEKEPFAVIAVADGVTTSLYSEFGALCAVGLALRSTVGFLETCSHTQGLPLLQRPEADRLACWLGRDFSLYRTTIRQSQQAIMDALSTYVTQDNADASSLARGTARQHLRLLSEEGREHLSTTLIAICATPRWFTVAGFGNGMVWVGFSSGDLATLWQPDPSLELKCCLSTGAMPRAASYAWTASFDASGIVTVGAGTDGIPRVSALRSAVETLGSAATTQNVLARIVENQLEKCPRDTVDNAALARISVRFPA